jgi:hypothetical protein
MYTLIFKATILIVPIYWLWRTYIESVYNKGVQKQICRLALDGKGQKTPNH